jgi:hypothetical protein
VSAVSAVAAVAADSEARGYCRSGFTLSNTVAFLGPAPIFCSIAAHEPTTCDSIPTVGNADDDKVKSQCTRLPRPAKSVGLFAAPGALTGYTSQFLYTS